MNQYTILSTFDLPIKYKNLNIYPIKVKEYYEFTLYAMSLTLDKNSTPDAKIINMGYLEYLFHLATVNIEEAPYIIWLDRLLGLCLKDNKEEFEDMKESIKRYSFSEKKVVFTIGGEIYTEKDFEEIKNIICEQNLIELPDENIAKEVRDSLEKAMKYKEKLSGTKSGNFEDYIVSLAVATGWSYESIYELTIRKFTNSIRRLDNLIHYKIFLSASMSGMVEFKDKSFIKHWLTNLEEDKYSDVKMDLNDIENKISLESAKK